MDNLTEALDNGLEVDLIYLDFKKTLDTVPCERLLGVLEKYGIEGRAMGWIEGFLRQRDLRFAINGTYSKHEPIRYDTL